MRGARPALRRPALRAILDLGRDRLELVDDALHRLRRRSVALAAVESVRHPLGDLLAQSTDPQPLEQLVTRALRHVVPPFGPIEMLVSSFPRRTSLEPSRHGDRELSCARLGLAAGLEDLPIALHQVVDARM